MISEEKNPSRTILVVDDSPIERAIAVQILSSQPDWNVIATDSGASALERLNAGRVDLILSDLQMPGMSGLELLGAVMENHQDVPLIIMTSKGSEELAVSALNAGASNYVPKKQLQRDLVATASTVLESARRDQNQRRLWSCLTEQKIAFELPNDRTFIPHAVACVQETLLRFQLCDERDRIRIGVAMEEALVNAIVHGNLDVSSELRERPDDAYEQMIRLRRSESPYRERRIYVEILASHREATIIIRDEGRGFDVTKIADPTDPENLGKCSGRGILLMRTFLDEVRFNAAGNQVTMTKRAKATISPSTARIQNRKMAAAAY